MFDLFENIEDPNAKNTEFAQGAFIIYGGANMIADTLINRVEAILEHAPLRHMYTPGGLKMSIRTSNCGQNGWISDQYGYRYSHLDPISGKPWPAIPSELAQTATQKAAQCGYPDFQPDACIINQYTPGTKLSLHQDKDEQDFNAPIVSVSLGLPAIFQFGGINRSDPIKKLRLSHGDIVVWGGPSRLFFHGIEPLQHGHHADLGDRRINLTLRKAS